MKRFKNQAAQGDMLARLIPALPDGVKPIPAAGGEHIIAHSETGHHHVVLERPGVEHYADAMDKLRSFLVVPPGELVQLIHKRTAHTHETLEFGPGVWEIRRQREFDVTAGWRLAAD